jgi:hypothetical protein
VSRHNIVIVQGTTWSIAWPILDTNGAPMDMTGWSVRSQIRADVDAPTALYEWSTVVGNASVTDNRVTLTVRPTESAAWTWDSGVYDVELTDLLGRVARIASGAVVVSPEVTR